MYMSMRGRCMAPPVGSCRNAASCTRMQSAMVSSAVTSSLLMMSMSGLMWGAGEAVDPVLSKRKAGGDGHAVSGGVDATAGTAVGPCDDAPVVLAVDGAVRGERGLPPHLCPRRARRGRGARRRRQRGAAQDPQRV